ENYARDHASEAPPRAAHGRLALGILVRGLLTAGLGELVDIAHATIQDWRDPRIGLGAFLGFVGQHRFLDEPPNQALQRVVGALELGGMVNRSGRTRLAAQAAVHALGDVDIELRNHHRAGLGVLLARDYDAIDRAGAFARQAAGADLQIDFQDAPVAE